MYKLTKDSLTAHYVDIDENRFLLMFKYMGVTKKSLLKFKLGKNSTLKELFDFISMRIDRRENNKQEKGGNICQQCISMQIINKNGIMVDYGVICKKIFINNSEIKFQISNLITNSKVTYPVVFNYPYIENIQLPRSLLLGYPINPNRFKSKNIDIHASEFFWYRIVGENDILVGNKYTYTPIEKDLGCKLKFKCYPKKFKKEGIEYQLVSKSTVEIGPECPFQERHIITSNKNEKNIFRVVSYNILDHASDACFPYCPSKFLQIDYRKQLILKEIIGYNADIICLQEVNIYLYFNDLLTTLSPLGYDVIFSLKGDSKVKGSACIYDKNRFRLTGSERIVLGVDMKTNNVLSDIYQEIMQMPEIEESIASKNTTIQILTLESIENNCKLIVANVHLHWEPDAENIRLIQTGLLTRILEDRSSQLKKSEIHKDVPLILCGDLNTGPDSEIYHLITQGIRIPKLEDWSNVDCTVENMTFSHHLNLKSAYDEVKYTNYTAEFKGCLDYIFYNQDTFDIIRNVPLYTEDQLSKDVALPSKEFPSDHIALIADLKLN